MYRIMANRVSASVCLCYSGLRKLVFGNFGYAMGEFYRGIYKAAQVKELQKFVPSLKTSDVVKCVTYLLTYLLINLVTFPPVDSSDISTSRSSSTPSAF